MYHDAGRSRRHPSLGFTLVELLVAVSVFAVLSLMAFSGLRSVLAAQELVEENAGELARIQLAVSLLERDLTQAVPRGIRDRLGGSLPKLEGHIAAFELSRAAWQNPMQQQRAAVQRVRYAWSNRDLTRAYWNVLDRSQSSEPFIQQILDEVTDFRMRYRDDQGRWHNQWPAGRDDGAWPTAVAFHLTLESFGVIHRIVPLADRSDPAEPKPAPDAS